MAVYPAGFLREHWQETERNWVSRIENERRQRERPLLELEPLVRDPTPIAFTYGGIKYDVFRVKDGFAFACQEPKEGRVFCEVSSAITMKWGGVP